MSHILACTDGSLYAHSVLDYAAWAARKTAQPVRVLHMLNPHHDRLIRTDYSGNIGYGTKSGFSDEWLVHETANAKILRKRGETLLAEAEARLAGAGARTNEAEQRYGKLSEEIAHAEIQPTLVVLGKRGENADFEKGHLGSTLERVLRTCQQPVLAVSRDFTAPETCLIAFDGGPSAVKAVDYLADSPLLQGGRIHLLSAGAGVPDVRSALQTAEEKLAAAGYAVSSEVLPGEPEDTIPEYIRQHKVDCLIMGAHGHSRIRQLIIGSTTTTLIRTVQIPVLLFR